ncbi:MAG: electron transporter RnfD, partial [Planctomycetaceae bacterium]
MMTRLTRTLLIRSSPHVHSGASVDTIMRHVALALLPACGFAVFHFGLSALAVLLTACLACLLAERGLAPQLVNARRSDVSSGTSLRFPSSSLGRLGDGSALVTGLLYGMTLPPSLPLWMVAVGGFFGVAIGKWLLGGLGSNPFNPALVGRAFLQAAFPAAMTSWPATPENRWVAFPPSTLAWPLTQPNAPIATDGVTAATPLAGYKFAGQVTETADLLWGTIGGSVGETSAVLILLGGLYLAVRRMLDWRIPATILLTVTALSGLLSGLIPGRCPGPLF